VLGLILLRLAVAGLCPSTFKSERTRWRSIGADSQL